MSLDARRLLMAPPRPGKLPMNEASSGKVAVKKAITTGELIGASEHRVRTHFHIL
jgi:hypothetical protein